GPAGGPASSGVAAFVLHSPALGAIEVRITLAPGGVRAGVITAPGEAAEAAGRALQQLQDRLAAATGRPAAVAVSPRPPGVPAPRPPEGRIDVAA
ncbi:MAG TPA: flagellar hook-length control protein FliK, partial [Gaiellales bacterium]|nr:flagellar hook-length control protein FliK [Gaiellales bacterium]